jgi:hypothetical protein
VATLGTSTSAGVTSCHGYEAVADDGSAGVVETSLFPPGCDEPDYLVILVRPRGRLFPRFPVVPTALVVGIDHDARRIRLAGRRNDIERLPEQVPVSF